MTTHHRAVLVTTLAVLLAGTALFAQEGASPSREARAKLEQYRESPSIHQDATKGTLARRTEGFEAILGYVGPAFIGSPSERVVVLTDTVQETEGSVWTARGLLRNETKSIARAPQVTAHLFDAGHHEVTTVQAPVLLDVVRPGEPAPFVIHSTVSSTLVASVEWTVKYDTTPRLTTEWTGALSATNSDGRSLQFTVFWQRAYGYGDRRYGYPQNDSGNGPFPYVVFGELHNAGSYSLASARVLAAWLDDIGRVIHVDWLSLRPAAEGLKVQPSSTLAGGDDIDFFYTNNDPTIAPGLSEARLVLWGTDSE